MRNKIYLLLLSAIILNYGCNEKVSPKLQDANSSSTVNDTETPEEYYFEVTNESSVLLNYKLHQTGSGNKDAKCKISKNIPLSNTLYSSEDEGSDITCFFEAEELSLHHGGFSLGIKASKNTCEYIGYSPFSFYNRMPGSSSTTITKIDCGGAAITSLQIDNILGAGTTATDAGAQDFNCNFNYLDTSVNIDNTNRVTNRSAFTVESDEDLCRFNYKTGDEEQCDPGVITINEYALTLDTDTNTVSSELTVSTLECGGEHYNCIRGPIRNLTTEHSRYVEILNTTKNEDFSNQYDYEGTIGQGIPGWEYVNFRRDLASYDIDFEDGDGMNSTYMNAFGGAKDFTPLILDRYSNNKKLNGTDLISSTEWLNNSFYQNSNGFNLQVAVPWAAEAYLGLVARTNPFYTFYCLDNAYDIKSRIRVMVRDWDRVYPDSSNIELISDINLGTSARQDVGTAEEITDDQDPLNVYNDRRDWDDFLPMTRTAGGFNSSTTIWEPSNGFFNYSVFPNTSYEN